MFVAKKKDETPYYIQDRIGGKKMGGKELKKGVPMLQKRVSHKFINRRERNQCLEKAEETSLPIKRGKFNLLKKGVNEYSSRKEICSVISFEGGIFFNVRVIHRNFNETGPST